MLQHKMPQKYSRSQETTTSNYANKMDNLEERDKFLGSDNLQRMDKEEIDIINRSITRPKIENVIKDLPTNKCPGPDDSTREFYLIFRVNTYPSETLSKNCRGRSTSKLILQGHHHPDTKTKDNTKKKTRGCYD